MNAVALARAVQKRGVADRVSNTSKECAMKRLLIPALTTMFIIVLAGVGSTAEIFWNPDETYDATITQKDFPLQRDFTNPTKSFQEMDIYYTPSQVTTEEEEEEAPTVRRPARRREAVDQPPAEMVPRRSRSRTRPALTTEPRPIEKPKPTATKKSEKPQMTLETKKPAAGAPELKGKKSMKWGQVEVKPAEPKTRAPLQWGQNNK
jgi:hypothetical protein